MILTRIDSRALSHVEAFLALRVPFGSAPYINGAMWRRYERRLEMIDGQQPGAALLRDAIRTANAERLYEILGDPLVRRAIDDAVLHHRLKLVHADERALEELFQDAIRRLRLRDGVGPLKEAAGSATLRTARHVRLWQDPSASAPHADRFRHVVEQRFAHLHLAELDPKVRENLDRGAELLGLLVPVLSRSALAHTHVVAIVHGASEEVFRSATTAGLLGAMFLGEAAVETPWRAAEHLLHESLHLKFIDIEQSHSFFRRGYEAQSSPTTKPPWHRPGNDKGWPVNRVMTVMHVYTCLAVFFAATVERGAELAERFGEVDLAQMGLEAGRAAHRAYYLRDALMRHRDELGIGGLRFVEWIDEALAALVPERPPLDGVVHHLLDLYDRETLQYRTMLAATVPRGESADIASLVTQIADDDLVKARRIFDFVGGDSPLSASREPHPDDVASRFAAVRGAIAGSLRRVAASLTEREPEDASTRELVRELVLGSRDRFEALRARLA
jgi:hypothetical protein